MTYLNTKSYDHLVDVLDSWAQIHKIKDVREPASSYYVAFTIGGGGAHKIYFIAFKHNFIASRNLAIAAWLVSRDCLCVSVYLSVRALQVVVQEFHHVTAYI